MKNNFKDMSEEALIRQLDIRKTTRDVNNPITAEEISQIEQELEKFKGWFLKGFPLTRKSGRIKSALIAAYATVIRAQKKVLSTPQKVLTRPLIYARLV